MKASTWLLSAIACLAVLLASGVRADPQNASAAPINPLKIPVPSTGALADASKSVDEVFTDDIAKATTVEQKTALSAKLLRTGIDEKKDMAAKFALFQRARDIACEAGDLDSACNAIDEVGSTFQVDVPLLKGESAVLISKSPGANRKKLAVAVAAMAEDAMDTSDFDRAKSLGDLAASVARDAKDPALFDQIIARSTEIDETQAAHEKIKSAEIALNEKPTDPDANLKVGTFLCFVRGDWTTGLPMLGRSSDAALKTLATTELGSPTSAGSNAALADGWWAIADKETGNEKLEIRSHAGPFYQKDLSGLTGPAKLKAQRRWADAAAADRQLQTSGFRSAVRSGAHGGSHVVDLLHEINTGEQAVLGTWQIKDGALVSDTGRPSRFEFNYHPPREYDYTVVFTRVSGGDCIELVLCSAGRQFDWVMAGWGNSIFGFRGINSQDADNNPTTVHGLSLQNDKLYTCIVKVRANEVTAYLDGVPISSWKTDYLDVGRNISLHRTDTIGLCTWGSSYVISKAEVTEISGAGSAVLKTDPPAAKVVAVFKYNMKGDPGRMVALFSDGHFVDSHKWNPAETRWFVEGDTILFLWGGYRDICTLSSDRKTFQGKNEKGELIHGEWMRGNLAEFLANPQKRL